VINRPTGRIVMSNTPRAQHCALWRVKLTLAKDLEDAGQLVLAECV